MKNFKIYFSPAFLGTIQTTFIILSSVLASLISSAFIEIARENDLKLTKQHEVELEQAYQKGLADAKKDYD